MRLLLSCAHETLQNRSVCLLHTKGIPHSAQSLGSHAIMTSLIWHQRRQHPLRQNATFSNHFLLYIASNGTGILLDIIKRFLMLMLARSPSFSYCSLKAIATATTTKCWSSAQRAPDRLWRLLRRDLRQGRCRGSHAGHAYRRSGRQAVARRWYRDNQPPS